MRQFSYSTLAVAAALAMGFSAAANAAPEIHGRLVLGMVAGNEDTTTTDLVTSTATKNSDDRMVMHGNSRIRVSGEEKMSDKVDLEYWLDYNVAIDQFKDKEKDKQQNFTARNIYLGLKHKDYGNVQFGRLYTPDDDIDYVDESWYFSADVPWSYAGERTNNTLRYTTPGFGKDKKTTATFQYALDEGKDSSNLAAANILYEGDKLKLGASHVNKGDSFNSSRLMVAYEPNEQWKFGTLAQYADYNTSDNELAVLASAYYKYNKDLAFYGQAGLASNYEGHKDGEKLTASVGAISTLKKEGSNRVRVYSALNYADTTSFEGTTKTETSGFALEAGLRYDF